jgi:hypothetical protein
MSSQILPLTPAAQQTITATLQVNGGSLTLGISQYWNRVGGFWCFDIYSASGALLVSSVPLITGDWPGANILAQYEYLQIGEAYVINQNGAATDWPNDVNLGSGFILLWDSNNPPGSIPLLPSVPQVSGSGNWSSYNVSQLQNIF